MDQPDGTTPGRRHPLAGGAFAYLRREGQSIVLGVDPTTVTIEHLDVDQASDGPESSVHEALRQKIHDAEVGVHGDIYDLVPWLHRQEAWSLETFGPGERVAAHIDHIEKELVEIADEPHSLTEWVDVVVLALDGAWRQGFTAEQIAYELFAKQVKNMGRDWPDWRTQPEDKAIEHIRDGDAA